MGLVLDLHGPSLDIDSEVEVLGLIQGQDTRLQLMMDHFWILFGVSYLECFLTWYL